MISYVWDLCEQYPCNVWEAVLVDADEFLLELLGMSVLQLIIITSGLRAVSTQHVKD